MNIQGGNFVGSLIHERKPGYTLPAELYTSQDAFEVDLEIFFRRHWIVAGVEADVPEPGDIKTLEIGKTSIIIARDDDGRLQAFHNVCRHRGARLITEHKTSVGRLVCPYHQWSYDLDGSLVYASQMNNEIDRSCRSLRPVHIRSIAGLLMICIDENAPADIDDFEKLATPRLLPFGLAEAKIAHEEVLIEEGNWKLSVDNNRECYHCEGSHPELCRTLNGLDIGFDPGALTEEQLEEWNKHSAEVVQETARWEAAGFPSSLIEEITGRTTMLRTQRFVIAESGESHTMDSKAASKRLMGEMPEFRMGDTHMHTHNSWHHFFADHAVVSYIIPLSPSRTELRSLWLVHKDAKEGFDYDLNNLITVWKATNQQDADLVKLAQQGVETTGYVPGPLSRHVERLVDLNLNWYIERLRAAGY